MPDDEFRYDLRKIVSFPGFNVPKADVKEVIQNIRYVHKICLSNLYHTYLWFALMIFDALFNMADRYLS